MARLLRAFLVVLLLAAGLIAGSQAIADPGREGICVGGRIATDEAGDSTYAGQSGTGLESEAGDILHIRSSIRPENAGRPVIVSTYVGELDDTGPEHFDLLVVLEFVDQTGRTIELRARRSSLTGVSGTADGSSEGVRAEFDTVRDRIRLFVPASVFEGAETVKLVHAETRYDSGAALSPLADEASGDCLSTFVGGVTAPTATLSERDVTVLAIDTGVNAHHPEFADGQIVAWWDFSARAADPKPGIRTWMDTDGDGQLQGDRDDPYDPNRHGTAVASMAVGSNALNPKKTPSACPGCRLAVAKVLNEDTDALDGSVGAAIRWGVDVVGVDVVTVSIGALVPVPAALVAETYDAITYARSRGVLVLFANGNGWGNAGVPGQPGGVMPYGNSTDALSVGANGTDSFLVTTDPEVVAVFSVHAAGHQGAGYQDISGTSFSTPFTAGVAARIIGEGRACGTGYDLRPDSLEDLIKRVAIDRPEVPPTFEGHGEVTLDSLGTAYRVVCLGEEPPALDPLNEAYMANVSGPQRRVSSDTGPGLGLGTTRTGPTDQTPQGVLGTSAPSGPADAEIYTTTVAPGEKLTVTAEGVGDLVEAQDFDMVLYAGVADQYAPDDELASSGEAGAVKERFVWWNQTGTAVDVSVVVYGWAVLDSQAFTISSSHPLSLDYDGYVLADNLL